MGTTGSGKSTTINYLIGQPMKAMEEQIVVDGEAIMEIGHTDDSCTIFAKIYEALHFFLCDMPGAHDNRGEEYKIATAIAKNAFISQISNLVVVMVIDWRNFDTDRGHMVRNILKELKEIFPRFDDHRESFVFLITKMPDNKLEMTYKNEYWKTY